MPFARWRASPIHCSTFAAAHIAHPPKQQQWQCSSFDVLQPHLSATARSGSSVASGTPVAMQAAPPDYVKARAAFPATVVTCPAPCAGTKWHSSVACAGPLPVPLAARGCDAEAGAAPSLMDGQPRPSFIKALTALRVLQAALLGINIFLAVPSFCLDVVWLAFTAAPRARARSCGGRLSCTRFSCDLAWDIVFTALWAGTVSLHSTAAAVVAKTTSAGAVFVGLAVEVLVFGLHIATAVLSGRVRRQLLLIVAATILHTAQQ